MRTLKFRPREGWRIFAGEVGVIVLGVLIALGAQQLADAWQWRQTVARTKADLDDQIRADIVNIAERKAVDPCLSQRLAELATKVAASRGEWIADPYRLPGEGKVAGTVSYAVPPAYRMPARNYPVDVWEQAKASGILTHMAQQDISRYAVIFDDIVDVRVQNNAEREHAAILSFLSFDGPLSPQDRALALSTISRLDYLNKDILYTLERLVAHARPLGAPLSADDEKALASYLEVQRKFRGPCVDTKAALDVLAPLRRR